MKIVLRVWLIFLFVMFACLSPVLAMTKSYNGTGGGPTERAAIQDAFRKILENAQGIDVESNSYLTNSTIDRDNIHTYTNGHIESYTLLDSHFDGTAYTVEVQAEVASGDGSVTQQSVSPSQHLGVSDLIIGLDIRTVGSRLNMGTIKGDRSVEADITNYLVAAGFTHIFPVDEVDTGPFDYVVSGTLVTKDMLMNLSTKIPLYANQAVLSVKVTRCGSGGENVLTEEYLGSSIDISKQNSEISAKRVAGSKAAEAIASVLHNVAVNAKKSYTITVHNVKNFRQITTLKDYLSNACNAENVIVKTFDENNAVLTLDFTGETDDLAAMLTQNPNYLAIITKITASTIELTY
jgi:hypothetical protein